MSHLDARLGRGYSAVGATLEQLPAMLALDERNSAARALCVELARATGGKSLQWRMVRLIGAARMKPLLMLLSPRRSSRAGYSRQAIRRIAFASLTRGECGRLGS